MHRIILFITLIFSATLHADIQDRMAIFTQQSDLFRQICFLPDGTFLADRILFDAHTSIRETGFDCNAQAIALRSEYNAIEAFTQSEQCPNDARVDDEGLVSLLSGASGVVEELACPGIRDAKSCMNGVACNLLSSVIPAGVAVARAFGDSPLLKSCQGSGSCLTNLGKAIWDNLWDTVKGLYHLGTKGINWVGEKLGSLWGAEDATSTRGIAATEITDSQLDQFIAHPVDYIYNMGKKFLNMIVEGISSRYGCAEWTGVPHLSECLKPMSFSCANCHEKLNMICGVAGYIGANFISNFFTGGAVATVQISAKIAKAATFKVVSHVPGGARVLERMARGGRLGRMTGPIGGTIKNAWQAVKGSRTIKGVLTVAGKVNRAARKKIFLYAQGQDVVIAAARAYNRMTLGAYQKGYRATHRAAENTRNFLYTKYPLFSDISAGRYANVANPQQYLREATKNMPAADRRHMRIAVTTDSATQKRVVIYDNRVGKLRTDVTFNFSPQVPPVIVARAAPQEITAVEEIVVTGRRRVRRTSGSGNSATTPLPSGNRP